MIVALATPRVAASVDEALETVDRMLADASARGARIVCFPEAYLPGLRGLDFDVAPFEPEDQERCLRAVAEMARRHQVATVLGMEWIADAGRQIASAAWDAGGIFLGVQTKNQLDPTEEPLYVPGDARQVFEIEGLRFGISICHEGFRYPETVRWAAVRGAQLVFHPHCTGSDRVGRRPERWSDPSSPYYEKAMMCRGLENGVYFASVNYAFRYQDSASTIIGPGGELVAHLPYGEEGVLVHELDLSAATGLLASRYAPERYHDAAAPTSTA